MRLRNDFRKSILFELVCKLALLLYLLKIGRIMSKKVFFRYILMVVKYLATLALGYLGGATDVL